MSQSEARHLGLDSGPARFFVLFASFVPSPERLFLTAPQNSSAFIGQGSREAPAANPLDSPPLRPPTCINRLGGKKRATKGTWLTGGARSGGKRARPTRARRPERLLAPP